MSNDTLSNDRSNDTRVAEPAVLPPRAGIALLTLQLRAALQEAALAETDEASWDLDAAIGQLRSKLMPLVEARRRALDEGLARESADAAAAVAAAQAQVSLVVAEALPMIAAEMPAAETPLVAAADEAGWDVDAALMQLRARMAQLVVDRRRQLDEALEQERTDAIVAVSAAHAEAASIVAGVAFVAHEIATISPWSAPSPWPAPNREDAPATTVAAEVPSTVAEIAAEVTEATTEGRDPSSMTVVIDADSFARAFGAAFATAFAAALDERLATMTTGTQQAIYMPPAGYWQAAPVPVVTKKSSTWHADFLLSVLAMIIVLVVLIAWST